MKHLFYSFLLVFLTNTAFGQIETWIEQAKTAEGKAKVDLYNKIAEAYTYDSEPFSAKTYADKAIEFADKIDYSDGLAVAYFFLAESHNLNSDLKAAEKTYKKWYKIRKKEGTNEQINWAIIGMARFYQSQEHDKKTECYFKKALKTAEKGSYREFSILMALANYYQYGKSFNNNRELNLKKGTKYFELMTASGRKVYGKDFSTGNLDNYFSSELAKALENQQTNLANTIAQQWLESKAKFANSEDLYRTSRLITRAFFDKQVYESVTTYLDKSIDFAIKSGEERWIRKAYNNAIYIARMSKKYEASLKYGFASLKYEKYPNEVISALNACLYNIEKARNPDLTQKAIRLISNWQKTLHAEKDKIAYDWTVDQLKSLN